MNDNIALITENIDNLKYFLSNVKVFRRCYSISEIQIANIRKVCFEDYSLVLFDIDSYSDDEIFKTLEVINKTPINIPVIFIYSKINSDAMFDYYQNGVCDFININLPFQESEIRILNFLKRKTLSEYSNILFNFVNISNCINSKTGLYSHKALSEVFDYLKELNIFKNSVYAVLSLDDKTKTKVSMNRLAINLKKYLRKTDIIAQGTGKFYLLLPDTNLSNAKYVIEKISNAMGSDIIIHSGITQIGFKNFFEVEKLANDGLKSAIINNKLCVSLESEYSVDENWVSSPNSDKHYKLFQKSFENKLSSIIQPVFLRYERDLVLKRPDLCISQYANKIECIFSLKDDNRQSELAIRYDGFAKLNILITHKGLSTSENSSLQLPLNKLNEKCLLKFLNNLYSEFNSETKD